MRRRDRLLAWRLEHVGSVWLIRLTPRGKPDAIEHRVFCSVTFPALTPLEPHLYFNLDNWGSDCEMVCKTNRVLTICVA